MLNCRVGTFTSPPHSTVSTPFTYYPRTAPARAIPPRLEPRTTNPGLHITSDWRVHESPIAARLPGSSKGIICKVRFPRRLFPAAQSHTYHGLTVWKRFTPPHRTWFVCAARSRTTSRLRGPLSPWQRFSLICHREWVQQRSARVHGSSSSAKLASTSSACASHFPRCQPPTNLCF